jgi:hypothetical protein
MLIHNVTRSFLRSREQIDVLYPPPPKVERDETKDELETMSADEVFAMMMNKTRAGSEDSDLAAAAAAAGGGGATNGGAAGGDDDVMGEIDSL